MTPGSIMRVICSIFVVPLVPAIKCIEARQQRPRVGAIAAHAGDAQMVGKSDVEVGLPSDNQGETAF